MCDQPWFIVIPTVETSPEQELLDEWSMWNEELDWEGSSMDEQYPV